LSRPAPGLSRGGEPGQGRSVGEGPPVGGRGKGIGSGSGGKRTRCASGGQDSPVCEREIRQFAVRHGGGDRHGAPYQGPLVPVVRRCFRDAPHVYPQTETYIYIYICIYIHTMLLSGRWCTTLVARYIFLQIRWVPIPRRQYLGGMVPNARRRGGCCPGVHPKGPRDFRDFSNG
jgi:hypothetical protein